MSISSAPTRVSLLALPESMGGPIHGLYETFVVVNALNGRGAPERKLFEVEIVGSGVGASLSATGLPLAIHRSIHDVESTDVVIMASMLFDEWATGRYPETVEWLRRMHAHGADLASACAGASCCLPRPGCSMG